MEERKDERESGKRGGIWKRRMNKEGEKGWKDKKVQASGFCFFVYLSDLLDCIKREDFWIDHRESAIASHFRSQI